MIATKKDAIASRFAIALIEAGALVRRDTRDYVVGLNPPLQKVRDQMRSFKSLNLRQSLCQQLVL
jgi:hypothetical protein